MKKTTLQTSGWLLTWASVNLGSGHSPLSRSWAMTRSWTRPGWLPTCQSSMSSSVGHLYLLQVFEPTVFSCTLLYELCLLLALLLCVVDTRAQFTFIILSSPHLESILLHLTWLSSFLSLQSQTLIVTTLSSLFLLLIFCISLCDLKIHRNKESIKSRKRNALKLIWFPVNMPVFSVSQLKWHDRNV